MIAFRPAEPGRQRIIFCRDCSTYIEQRNRHTGRRVCVPCGAKRYLNNGRDIAGTVLRKAVRDGMIPRPSEFACVDCGIQATEYDHRDYSKPLDVEPVCHGCNQRRGPGKWTKYEPLRAGRRT